MSRRTSPSPPSSYRHSIVLDGRGRSTTPSDVRRGRPVSTLECSNVERVNDFAIRPCSIGRQPSRGRRASTAIIYEEPLTPIERSGSSRRRSISREPSVTRHANHSRSRSRSIAHADADRAWIASYSSGSRPSTPPQKDGTSSKPRPSRRMSILSRSSPPRKTLDEDEESLLPSRSPSPALARSRRQSLLREATPDMHISDHIKRRLPSTSRLSYSRLGSPERDMKRRNTVFRTSSRSRSHSLQIIPPPPFHHTVEVQSSMVNPFSDPKICSPLIVQPVNLEIRRPRSKSRNASRSRLSRGESAATGKIAKMAQILGLWSRGRSVHGAGESKPSKRHYSVIV